MKRYLSVRFNTQGQLWLRDTGQQRTSFDRYQLTITWMSNVKDVPYKPRLYVSVNLLAAV